MGPSRISGAGLSLLLFCCLIGGVGGVAGHAMGSVWVDDAGPATTTDVADESYDSSPSEDAQTTETASSAENDTTTPTPTETATPTPTGTESSTPSATPTDTPASDDGGTGRTTSTDDADGTPEGGDSRDGADGSDGTDAPDADAESRDPSDFEEAAEGGRTDDTDDSDATDDADGESRDGAPAVETRARSRMPTRGPERGTVVVSFDAGPVSTISFSRRAYGNVTVEVLDGLPSGVQAPAGDRLMTLRITVPSELRDAPAKVMFAVDVATLEAQGIPNDAVWLAHHDPDAGEWDRRETHVVHASVERVVYAANASGFSLFAIQGDRGRVRSPTPTEAADESGADAGHGTTADEAEAAFVGGFGLSMGVVLFLGAVSVTTTVLGARRVSGVEPREEN